MAGRIAYYGNIVRDGLVLNLDAAKRDSYPGSGTVWRDIAGGVINGSLINGPTFNPNNFGSIVFDGVDDFVSCGNVLFNDVNATTISIWVNIQTFIGNKSIISKGAQGEGSNTTFAAWIIVSTTRIRNRFFNSTGTAGNVTTPDLSANTWYNIIWTYNGSTIAVYTNGIAGETVSLLGPLKTNTNPIRIGQDIYGNNTAMTCASAQIYNRALSATEVLQNYNAQKGRYGL
jgi:hypothetical protein